MNDMIKRPLLAAALLIPLSGCAMPTPVSIVSLVFDIGSYAISGKTVTDHGLSLLAQQDCAMMKVFEGKICEAYPDYENVALATLEPLAPGSQEWAFAGDAVRQAKEGPLGDLTYIESQTAELLPAYPTGRDNGETFRTVGSSQSTPAGTTPAAPAEQFAALPGDQAGSLLGLGGYLKDSALPASLQ